MTEPKNQTESGQLSSLTGVFGIDYTKDTKKLLGFIIVTDNTVPPDVIEFWQDGKRIGSIVGLAPNKI